MFLDSLSIHLAVCIKRNRLDEQPLCRKFVRRKFVGKLYLMVFEVVLLAFYNDCEFCVILLIYKRHDNNEPATRNLRISIFYLSQLHTEAVDFYLEVLPAYLHQILVISIVAKVASAIVTLTIYIQELRLVFFLIHPIAWCELASTKA